MGITQNDGDGEAQSIQAGSHAEFITEHYWGYTALRSGCSEYRVEHPRWRIWHATSFEFNADVKALYGDQFAQVLNQSPRSAFIAIGPPITVHTREVLRAAVYDRRNQCLGSRFVSGCRSVCCEPAAAAAASGPSNCSSISVVCNCLRAAGQSALSDWLEVVLVHVPTNISPEVRAFLARVAKMEAGQGPRRVTSLTAS